MAHFQTVTLEAANPYKSDILFVCSWACPFPWLGVATIGPIATKYTLYSSLQQNQIHPCAEPEDKGKGKQKGKDGKGYDGKGYDGKGYDGKGPDGKGYDGKGHDGKGYGGGKGKEGGANCGWAGPTEVLSILRVIKLCWLPNTLKFHCPTELSNYTLYLPDAFVSVDESTMIIFDEFDAKSSVTEFYWKAMWSAEGDRSPHIVSCKLKWGISRRVHWHDSGRHLFKKSLMAFLLS